MAKGTEDTGHQGSPITLEINQEKIPFNPDPTPTSLVAGVYGDVRIPFQHWYGTKSDSLKEIHLFHVKNDGQIGELITTDFGNTWNFGPLNLQSFDIALPGGLAAYPGELWRVVIRVQGRPHTLMELYQQGGEEA